MTSVCSCTWESGSKAYVFQFLVSESPLYSLVSLLKIHIAEDLLTKLRFLFSRVSAVNFSSPENNPHNGDSKEKYQVFHFITIVLLSTHWF